MGNLNVAVLGREGFGARLGKKGTSSDITFYNLKRGEDTVTFVEPTKYPERLAPLFFAVSIAKMAVVVVDQIGPSFGEMALMLHSAGIERGYIFLSGVQRDKVAQLVKGTLLEAYEIFDGDVNSLRETMISHASHGMEAAAGGGAGGCVAVDHAFNVKGTGTVVLGTVMCGTVRRHDEMRVLPGEKMAQVRSIQKHDDDFDSASEGDRVGLALRGIQPEDLGRGNLLTSCSSFETAHRLEAQAELLRYWPGPMDAGTVVHVGHWMQFVQGKIEEVGAERDWHRPALKVSLGKAIAYLPGAHGVLMQLDGKKLRVAGRIQLSAPRK